MKVLVMLLALVCASGCASVRAVRDDGVVRFPERSLADWHPDKAVAEAQHDIVAGTAKVYLSGTIVGFAPGVDGADYPLLISLPTADAGIGCLVSDSELRKAQFEYASRYNAYIVKHLKRKNSFRSEVQRNGSADGGR